MKLTLLEGMCPSCGHEAQVVTSRILCKNRNCQYYLPDDGGPEIEVDREGPFDDLASFNKCGLHNFNVPGPEMEIATKE